MFGVYALILATLTHWPKLQVQGPVPRTDLFAHVGAFSIWGALCIGAGLFGPALSGRNIAWCTLVGVIYAGVDELTQMIPGIHRHAVLSDWLANVGGILLASCGALAWRRARPAPMDGA